MSKFYKESFLKEKLSRQRKRKELQEKIQRKVLEVQDDPEIVDIKFKVIAALVCEDTKASGDEQFTTVILTAGTKEKFNCTYVEHLKDDKKYSWDICDGHAEAVCCQLASVYMLNELHNLQNNRCSIFEYFSKNQYRLKRNIKFHLFISHRPCGFMTDKGIPSLLSWKKNFTKKPHILQCSSKILISSFLGIQGPLSCLLTPVHISTLVIAEDEGLKESNIHPSYAEIYQNFKEFFKNLYSSQPSALKFVNCPNIIICKRNLRKIFPEIIPVCLTKESQKEVAGLGKEVTEKVPSHFTFQIPKIEKLDVGSTGLNNEADIILQYVKKVNFKIDIKDVCIKLRSYSSAVKDASQALQISNAITNSINSTYQEMEKCYKAFKSVRLDILERLSIVPVTGEAMQALGIQNHDDLGNDEKNYEFADLEKKWKEYREKLSALSKRYNGYCALREQKCCSLTEVDCDWAKCMLKIKYILQHA